VGNAARLAAEQITDAFKTNQKHARSLVKSISDVTASVEELAKRLAAAELPTERIDKQLGSIGDELDGIIKRVLASLEEMAQTLGTMKLPTQRIEEHIDSFGSEIEKRLLNRLTTVAEEVEKTSRRRTWFGMR
jgi:phosphoglycolate phosphatase-like HAD superfamily hydrolase